MNDSQISEVIEPPIEDLTNQKSSRSINYSESQIHNGQSKNYVIIVYFSYDYPYGVSTDYIVSNDYLPQSESSKEAFDE